MAAGGAGAAQGVSLRDRTPGDKLEFARISNHVAALIGARAGAAVIPLPL